MCRKIYLKCKDCDNTECKLARAYIPQDSQEGCVRTASEDQYEKYYHLFKEEMPFMYQDTDKSYQNRVYKNIVSFLAWLYDQDVCGKLDKNGKVKITSF